MRAHLRVSVCAIDSASSTENPVPAATAAAAAAAALLLALLLAILLLWRPRSSSRRLHTYASVARALAGLCHYE